MARRIAAMVVALVLLVPFAPAPALGAAPTIELSRSTVSPTGRVRVSGSGFSPRRADRLTARTTGLLDDLVQPAKSSALAKLGESGRAVQIATEWFRSNLEQGADDPAA